MGLNPIEGKKYFYAILIFKKGLLIITSSLYLFTSAGNSAHSDSRSNSASLRGGPPPPLPEELAELPSHVELNLAECNLAVIPPVVFRIESLR